MKNKLFALIIFALIVKVSGAQNDTLTNSIGYTGTLANQGFGTQLYSDDQSGYPKDLSVSSLFFIEINKKETKGNTGFLGPRYKKINSNLISKMEKLYPYTYKVFTTDFKSKGKKYFLSEGYKYRLLIQSKWYSYTSTTNGSTVTKWKQVFQVVIEDLQSGVKYSAGEMEWPGKYVKAFLKKI